MSESTYAELMARLRAGERDAQTEVFERYAQEVLRKVSECLRSLPKAAVGAEAVAQSVLLSYFARHVTDEVDLSKPDSLLALLLEIALRHCEKWNKRFRAAKRNAHTVPIGAGGGGAGGLDPEDDQEGPDEVAEFADYYQRFVGRLTPVQRRIVELRLEDRTIKQITQEVSLSQATVSRHLREIRSLLEDDKSSQPSQGVTDDA